MLRISGEVDWQKKSYTLSSGNHVLKWRYVKDDSGKAGDDCGRVDLVQWTGPSPRPDADDWQKITYKYDISGRRIKKTVDGYKTTYCYDGDHVLAEYDGNGNLLRKYVYGGRVDEPVCMIEVAAPPSVAHWKFNEGSGTTAYDSAGSNDGTIYGATWTTGKFGGALQFDGINDYVDCGNDASLEMATDDWTVSSWIKINSTTALNPIVVKGGRYSTNEGYNFWYRASDSNDLRFYIGNGTTRLYGNSNDNLNLNDSQWHFVAASVDRSSNVVFYLDGENVGSTDISSFDGQDISNSSQSLLIGRWSPYYFDGKIDDVRIYDVALSADEIEQLYDQGQSTATYYYHFDGLGSVVALSDSSGNTIQRYEYTVYGRVAAQDPNHPNPYMFTARRFDFETGLYYYRARYYNPYIGRFLQTDPVGYSTGLNLYTYCRNNPLARVDPYGLDSFTERIPANCIVDPDVQLRLQDSDDEEAYEYVDDWLDEVGFYDDYPDWELEDVDFDVGNFVATFDSGDATDVEVPTFEYFGLGSDAGGGRIIVIDGVGYLDDRQLNNIIRKSVSGVNKWWLFGHWTVNLAMHRWDLEYRCDTPFFDIRIINWKYKGKKCTRDEINYILEGHAMRHLEIPSDVAWAIVCLWKGHEYSKDPSTMVWYWWNKGYNEYGERKDW